MEILDATCPNVEHIHRLVSDAEARGRRPGDCGQQNPSRGTGDSGVVPVSADCGVGGGAGPLADGKNGSETVASDAGVADNFHKRNMGKGRKKSKKRVYKRRNI